MTERLGHSDHADLSAYLDGELPAGRAAEVERLVREDPAWRRAHREMTSLDAALDSYTAPTVPEGLADRILAGIAASELPPSDLDDLSAYADGELGPERAGEVERLLRDHPVWRRTHRELAATDTLLESYTVPAPPEDLADRVVLRTRRVARRRQAFRVAGWIGSAAAVAAIVLVAFAVWNWSTGTPQPQRQVASVLDREVENSEAFGDVPPAERVEMEKVVIEHFDIDIVRSFFRDYDVAVEFETLEAIDRLESEGT